jgi:phosphoribosyl 1,2-cyclic phosphodiesterase
LLRFASLGSGSRGNALVVEAGATRLLVDCGFGPRQLAQRLARLDLTADDLTAILVTHEHSDHAAGVAACAARYGLPVLLTYGTASQLDLGGVEVRLFDAHGPLAVDGLEVIPVAVPHDAREPVQFVISDGRVRLAILTDAGHVTEHMCAMVSGCHGLVLECNHDVDLLARGRYPEHLKRRIAGHFGHLDNEAAAGLLTRIDCTRLQRIVAAHLSEENNRPELARAALVRALACAGEDIAVADQANGFPWQVL